MTGTVVPVTGTVVPVTGTVVPSLPGSLNERALEANGEFKNYRKIGGRIHHVTSTEFELSMESIKK